MFAFKAPAGNLCQHTYKTSEDLKQERSNLSSGYNEQVLALREEGRGRQRKILQQIF